MTTPAPEVETPVHWAKYERGYIVLACGMLFAPEVWITDIPHKVTCPGCKKIMQGGQK